MRILYLSRARIPSKKAHVLQIHKMCDAFQKNGHEVILFHPTEYEGQPDPNRMKEKYGLENELTYCTIPCLNFHWLRQRTARLGFLLYAVSYCFAALIPLTKACWETDQPTVVYTRDRIFALILSALKPFLNPPIILELHDRPTTVNKPVLNRLFGRIDRFVVITNNLRDDLESAGIDPGKINVEPDGVDLEDFQVSESPSRLRREFDLPETAFIIGYVGHLYPFKGTNLILKLAENLPDLHFVTVGGTSEDRTRFEENKRALNLENITTIDHQHHTVIPKFLHCCDVLLLPLQGDKTREKRYSSPLKLFEYMAAGKPIVASNLPATREILTDGENALLADPKDPDEFKERIQTIKQSPDLAKNLGNEARETVERYTWTNRAKNVLRFDDKSRAK